VNIFKRDYGVLLLLPGAEVGRKGRLEARFHGCFMFCFALFCFVLFCFVCFVIMKLQCAVE
jgi:hypothetical protein